MMRTHMLFIQLYLFHSFTAYRHQAFFITLTYHPYKSYIKIHIADISKPVSSLTRRPQLYSGLQHGAVALAFGRAVVNGGK